VLVQLKRLPLWRSLLFFLLFGDEGICYNVALAVKDDGIIPPDFFKYNYGVCIERVDSSGREIGLLIEHLQQQQLIT
jgi:hypothetical protein